MISGFVVWREVVGSRTGLAQGETVVAQSRCGSCALRKPVPSLQLPWLARTAKRISSNSNNSNNNNNNNNNNTRIAITVTITLALLAAQQAHGWAQSCADGNTGAYCLLKQIWSLSNAMDVYAVASDVCWAKTSMLQGDPFRQRQWDLAIPLMCVTDC